MASIKQRGKTFEYCVSRYVNGKYKPIRKGGFASSTEAKVAALEVELQVKKKRNIIVKDKSLSSLFKEWIDTYKTGSISEKTTERYYAHQELVEEHFKDTAIQAISKMDYQKFLNEFAKTHAKESTRKLNTHIRACVKYAIEEGYIQNNFTENAIIFGKVKAKSEEEKYIEYDEAKRLYEYLINEEKIYLSHLLILLAVVSGMRFSELVGLNRSDFNFEENYITVNKTWDYKKEYFGNTKNEQSKRTLFIDKAVMEKFKDWFSMTEERSPIFSDKMHGVITNAATNKALRRMLKRLNIKSVTMHALRHTHGSMLLADGASIVYVSERLGHADVQTTNNVYSHILKKLRSKEDKRAMYLFSKKEEKE